MSSGLSYARALLFRRLSVLSKLDINQHTVEIESISPSKSKAGNTVIVLRSKVGSFFKGTKVYYYDRERLKAPTKPLKICIKGKKLAWVSELLPLINSSGDLRHDIKEIVNKRIGNTKTITVDFADDHPTWLGSFTVELFESNEQCSIINPDVIPKDDSPTEVKLGNTLYDLVDFSKYGDALSKLKVGQTVPLELVNVLSNEGSLRWVRIERPAAFNLMGAVVLYNGHSAKLPEAKLGTQKVLKVFLDKRYCTAVYGELLLYYN